ncbi:MAG TPA: hypothetical protein VF596_18345 [Pyrinomonadaceae bacterium]|jgi:hypothetical protein
MNRHIYGLTLFLIIVKIHFLLYWAFFAPINFFSTQDTPNTTVTQIENNEKPLCSNTVFNASQIISVLHNISINTKRNIVTANIGIKNLDRIDLTQLKPQIHIFNKETNETIVLRKIHMEKDTNNNLIITSVIPFSTTWYKKSNYYAQVYFMDHKISDNKVEDSSFESSVPVLLIREKED